VAKAEKLDRGAKLHTLCYHSPFFKESVSVQLPSVPIENLYPLKVPPAGNGRQTDVVFTSATKRFKIETIGTILHCF